MSLIDERAHAALPSSLGVAARQSSPIETPVHPSQLVVRQYTKRDFTDALLKRWRDLEERSTDASPYSSPDFILPALEFLTPRAEPLLFVVEHSSTGQWFAAGVFEKSTFSLRVPFPHLTAYKSIHAYQTGLLVDRDYTTPSLGVLFARLGESTQAIEMLYRAAGTPKWQALVEAAALHGFQWIEYRRFDRAVLWPQDNATTADHLSSKRKKAQRKSLRGLSQVGQLHYRVVREPRELTQALKIFLDLEDQGWKKECGVSLRANTKQLAFFNAMTERFRQEDRLRVCQLLVDDRVVSSTVHLLTGRISCAFKLGWDASFSKHKPGIVQQLLTAENVQADFNDCTLVDSSTEGDSFFEKLWPGRRTIVSGVFTKPGLGRLAVQGIDRLRRAKKKLPLSKLVPNSQPVGDPCGH